MDIICACVLVRSPVITSINCLINVTNIPTKKQKRVWMLKIKYHLHISCFVAMHNFWSSNEQTMRWSIYLGVSTAFHLLRGTMIHMVDNSWTRDTRMCSCTGLYNQTVIFQTHRLVVERLRPCLDNIYMYRHTHHNLKKQEVFNHN